MSAENYNLWAIIIGGLTLIALLLYTYYTRQLLLTSQLTTKSTQGELEVMQQQLILTQQSTQRELEILQEQLKLTQSTSDSTRKELEIMQAQLATSQKVMELQNEKELRQARPVFVWCGGGLPSQPTGFVHVRFQNKGGAIAILETRAVNCSLEMNPQNYISAGGEGTFTLRGNFTSVRYFGIRYVTDAREIGTVVFSIEAHTISPRVSAIYPFESMPKMPDVIQPVDLIDEESAK